MFASNDDSTNSTVGVILLIAIVVAVFLPWYSKRLKKPNYGLWAVGLAILSTLIYLIYEASMPTRMIRLDIIIVWPVMLFVWINAMLAYRDYEKTLPVEERSQSTSSYSRAGTEQHQVPKSNARSSLILAIVICIISLLHWYAGTGLSIILLYFLIADLVRSIVINRLRHGFWNRVLAIVIVLIGVLAGLLIHHGR